MAQYRYVESITLTIDQFREDPATAYKLRDEYHRVVITDSQGRPRLVILGKDVDDVVPKKRRSVK